MTTAEAAALRRAAILDQRTRTLASRTGPVAEAAAEPVCVLRIGTDVYAVALERVAGVVVPGPVAPLPGTHPLVAGVAHVGGRFHAVVDAGRLVGHPGGGETAHFLLLRWTPAVALPVARVLGTGVAIAVEGGDGVARITGVRGVDACPVLDLPRLLSPLFPSSGP